MKRITTVIIVFFIYFTAAANLLVESGVADQLGVGLSVTAGDRLAQAAEAMRSVQPGGGLTESLFGIYIAVTNTFSAFAAGVSAGPRLLINAGIPAYVVVFLFAPVGIYVGIDLAYTLSQRQL